MKLGKTSLRGILFIPRLIILPYVLYECETCFLSFREEHSLGVFCDRAFGSMFGPMQDKMIGDWKMLHYEDLHNLHSSRDSL
jgi:hypothetical protein